ncbi:unnamed protein product [Effrenium voratum]|nr:unnamed protein product [Effrenium voratum]
MADEAALIRAEEEARVATWCRQQGVANEMDLAFFYLTFDEAFGLAVTARPVMALGVPPPAPKPSASPRLRSRPEPVVITAHLPPSSYEASSSSHTVGENQLLAIMLACSSHRPSTANERDAMRAFVLDMVGRTEQVELNALTALQLAAFMRAHKAPTRAYNALFWMNKNLKLVYDTWTTLFAAHCMIFGVVRFAHIQRSVVHSVDDVAIYMWFSLDGVDIWLDLRVQLARFAAARKQAGLAAKGLCFDLNAMMPLKIQGFIQGVCGWLQDVIARPSQLSSYSLQRVAPTWGAIAGLSEPDKLALGNWISTSQVHAVEMGFAWGGEGFWSQDSLAGSAAEVINPDLPQQDDATLQVDEPAVDPSDPPQTDAFLKRQRISFVVSAMCYAGKGFGLGWSLCRAGESALIHCKAGVHRAPMLTAVILGILDDLTLDSTPGVEVMPSLTGAVSNFLGKRHFSHRWVVGPWTNPFLAGRDGTHFETVVLYMQKLLQTEAWQRDLESLEGKVCDCPANRLCHGDVLASAVWHRRQQSDGKSRRLKVLQELGRRWQPVTDCLAQFQLPEVASSTRGRHLGLIGLLCILADWPDTTFMRGLVQGFLCVGFSPHVPVYDCQPADWICPEDIWMTAEDDAARIRASLRPSEFDEAISDAGAKDEALGFCGPAMSWQELSAQGRRFRLIRRFCIRQPG